MIKTELLNILYKVFNALGLDYIAFKISEYSYSRTISDINEYYNYLVLGLVKVELKKEDSKSCCELCVFKASCNERILDKCISDGSENSYYVKKDSIISVLS